MTRLPKPGSDNGQWGDILNDYLSQSHASDGSLKDNVVGSAQLQAASVGASQLADGSVTSTAIADNAVGPSQLATNAVTASAIADSTITSSQLHTDITDKLDKADTSLQPDDADTAATPDKLVKRTSDGRIKAATATESDDVVKLGQMETEMTLGVPSGLWVPLGDSHTGPTGDTPPVNRQHRDTYHLWARYYLDGALHLVWNAGIQGNKSADALARVQTDVIAKLPNGGVCSIMLGTNDVLASVPLATYQANIIAIVDALVAAGIMPILLTIPPIGIPGTSPVTYTSGSSTQRTAGQLLLQTQINEWLISWGREHGIIAVDLTSALTNESDATHLANYTADGIHYLPKGARAVGRALATAIAPYVKPARPLLATSNIDPSLVNTNPLMLTNDGALPNGWSLSGAGSITTTVGDVAGFRGKALTVSGWSRSTPNKTVLAPLLPVAVGDRVRLAFRYRATGLEARGLRPRIGIRHNGGTYSWITQLWLEADTEGDHVIVIDGIADQVGATQMRFSIEPGSVGQSDPGARDSLTIGELSIRKIG